MCHFWRPVDCNKLQAPSIHPVPWSYWSNATDGLSSAGLHNEAPPPPKRWEAWVPPQTSSASNKAGQAMGHPSIGSRSSGVNNVALHSRHNTGGNGPKSCALVKSVNKCGEGGAQSLAPHPAVVRGGLLKPRSHLEPSRTQIVLHALRNTTVHLGRLGV